MSQVLAAAQAVLQRLGAPLAPKPIGLVLGSGLSSLADELEARVTIPYRDIPGFPPPAVPGHAGMLHVGSLEGVPVVCLAGRVHLYEGHPMDAVVLGVRLLAELGCPAVLLTNAAGGITSEMSPGDLMLIQDHLNLTGHNPLVGVHDGRGPRFLDLSCAYDRNLRELARRSARDVGVRLGQGIYAGLLGPSYETPAEVRMLAAFGANAVGMSTVCEVIALRQLGVRVGAISVITNYAAGRTDRALDHGEVEQIAGQARGKLSALVTRWVKLIAEKAR
ncbi:MAG TPA: purine-nucleoside phosphorylase [Polyangiaceae bacterium]|nr:purine-nucleoside phosphorylase [Polyangiaceae bacterium]